MQALDADKWRANLGAELEAVVREDAARASQEGYKPVDENVSRAISGDLRRSDGVHFGSVATPIRGTKGVGISLNITGRGPK